MKYDIAIIGGGIGGIMTAYRLVEKNHLLSGKKICIIEKGHELKKRVCPIIQKKTNKCIKCASCAIMEGMAGAGAFSDGKYVITTEYGGWLTDFLEPSVLMSYIEQADEILVKFGATTERYQPDNELKTLCLRHDLHMAQAELKHLGTDANFETMHHIIEFLRDKVDIITDTLVEDVALSSKTISCKELKNDNSYDINADKIIFAVGRAGSSFFSAWCKKNKIQLFNNQVDVGVRVELPYSIWQEFSKRIYEPKIAYRSKQYGDTTRMFCFNERGAVVTENTDGVLTVNGHAYRDQSRKTNNSNFALLSTIRFTKPFDEPIKYARAVASLANLISGGGVLVQRLGDLENGRRTDESRLRQSTTRPTLDAIPGDLSLCIPKRQLDNIVETLHALDKVAPGTANHDTLLYGVECKYYSARPETKNFRLAGHQDVFALGDGAGFTRSLSQAAANGLHVADLIVENLSE